MQSIWLVLLLILGLTSESTLVEPHGNKLSEVVDKGQQRLSTNNTLELVDVSCNTVTAYFNGTFQRQDKPNLKIDAQFQIRFQTSANTQIYFQLQQWNNDYLDSSETIFNIWVGPNYITQQCHLNQACRVPRPVNPDIFVIEILTHIGDSEWFFTHLFIFPSFLNQFTLKQAYKQCTKHKESSNDFSDPNLYHYCACCGEYNPDPNMYCPKNPWQDSSTTPQIQTKPVSTQKITKACQTSTAKSTTTQQPSTFIPCRKRIAFAFDDSSTNTYFNAVNNFLVNHIFSNGTWTHLERLGLLWYSNQNDKNVSFDVLNDKKHLNLAYVRQLIRNKPIKSSSTSNLTAALQYLAANFQPNNEYDEVFYIVFVSQKLDQKIVDAAQPFADALTNNGRLTLIGLGDDVGEEELYDLSPYSTVWDDPNNNPVLPDWEHFFWVTAYGCGKELEQFAWPNEEQAGVV